MSSVYEFKSSQWSSHTMLLKTLPQDGQGRLVLDVGCGPGYLGALLASRGYRVTGLERTGGYDPAAFPRDVRIIDADLEGGLPPLTDRYDFILCADILEHLRQPEQLLTQLREKLAPGGLLIASLPNSGNLWFRLNILLGRFPQDDKGLFDRTHVRFYMWDGWVGLFHRAGFRIQQVQPTSIPVSLVVSPAMADSVPVRAAESVFYGLALLRKQLFAYQFVVCASSV